MVLASAWWKYTIAGCSETSQGWFHLFLIDATHGVSQLNAVHYLLPKTTNCVGSTSED